MKNIAYLALIVLVVGGLWYLSTQSNKATDPNADADVVSNVEGTENWNRHQNPNLGFEIRYPESVKRIPNESGVIIFGETGPTQTQGTEGFDGLSVSIQSKPIDPEKSVLENINASLAQYTNNEVTQKPTVTKLGGKSGYVYKVNNVGEFTTYFLPVGKTSALEVSTWSADPTNKGFADIVSKMLATFKVTI